MASTKTFLDAVKDRRTIYQLNKQAPKSDKEIVDIVNQVVLHVPSSFNSQSTRVVVLLNQEHEKFSAEFLQMMKTMKRFIELSDQHTPYLLRKADRIQQYLDQR